MDMREARSRLIAAMRGQAGRDPLPLTADQQAIWLAEQVDPGRSGYHVTGGLRVMGALDVSALRSAFTVLQDSHEALRCRVLDVGGEPRQTFDVRRLDWSERDLAAAAPQAREIVLGRLVAMEATEPFDLAEGPLWRVRLIRTTSDEHVLLVIMHHLITDGRSLEVLLGDLLVQYEAALTGRPAPPRQPGDPYARWIAARVRQERQACTDEAMRRITARLGNAPYRPELPGLGPSGPEPVAARLELPCPPDVWPALAGICHRLGATANMALTGLFGLLLARVTGDREIVMAAPFANRADPATAGLLGCLMSLIPISVPITADDSPAEAVAAGRRALLAALRDTDVPYSLIARTLGLVSGTGDPLTSIGLQEFNTVIEPCEVAGVRLEQLPREAMRLRYDLALSIPTRLSRTPELLYTPERWATGSVEALAEELAAMVVQVATATS
ncbi:condensation domain-containing protein [Spongiactinospora sp. 9N601]|uniref:condensation domain-containing protein n=1 Tax=Spongiactinospora sp. 9N601 TaxID=3375149 RepID=UPI0037AA0712